MMIEGIYRKVLPRLFNNNSSESKKHYVAYDGEMYWIRKRTIHRTLALLFVFVVVFSSLFILVAFLSGSFAELLVNQYDKFSKMDSLNKQKDLTKSLEYIIQFQAIIVLGFVFWFLRIMYRILFHQMYLWQDAAERVTAIHTYYKLINTGFTIEERRYLLDTIFRSSIDTLHKVEIPHPSVLNTLSAKEKSS